MAAASTGWRRRGEGGRTGPAAAQALPLMRGPTPLSSRDTSIDPERPSMHRIMHLTILAAGGLAAQAGAARPVLEFPTRPRAAPKALHLPEAPYPEAEREAGHDGSVVIAAAVAEDGRIGGPVVVLESSRAPALDRLALDAARAATFEPPRDETGTPTEVPVRMTFVFGSYAAEGEGGGIDHYSCAALTRDATWWRSAFPEAKWTAFPVAAQLFVAPLLQYGHRIPIGVILDRMKQFPPKWEKVLEGCRKRPGAL